MNDQPTGSLTIMTIPRLLQVPELAGCIVTIDAISCQTEIAQTIVDREAACVLAVKENQGHLYEDIKGLFDAAQELNSKDVPYEYCKTTDKGHGRLEIRHRRTIPDPALINYLRNRNRLAQPAHDWQSLCCPAVSLPQEVRKSPGEV
jgi:predicted transposase YbfD/YdcC